MSPKGSWLEPHYSVRLVRPFLTCLEELLPEATPVMIQLLGQALDARMPVRVAHDLLDTAVVLTSRPDLGLLAAATLEYGSCDVLQFAASSAPTWGAALENILRYVRILNESAQFTLDVRGSVACVELRSSTAIHRAASDFQVSAIAQAARAWLGDLRTFEFWFAHDAPSDLTPYLTMFGPARFRFGAPIDAVLFDASLLGSAMPSADPELHAVLKRHAELLLSMVPESPSLVPRVRKVLVELMSNGAPDATKVAAKLGMSRRSLTRHLEREQITYSDLLEQIRHELALSYLCKTDHDVQEIAFLLGYSLTAAFSRAFRRWEGKSPIEYRRSLYGAQGAQSVAASQGRLASSLPASSRLASSAGQLSPAS